MRCHKIALGVVQGQAQQPAHPLQVGVALRGPRLSCPKPGLLLLAQWITSVHHCVAHDGPARLPRSDHPLASPLSGLALEAPVQRRKPEPGLS